MFDRMEWGVELVDRVGSDHLKILYDIYHAQIMEGDVIRTMRDYTDYIGHLHTAGVPGRNEINNTQELNYVGISRAIRDLDTDWYLAHEFRPTRDDAGNRPLLQNIWRHALCLFKRKSLRVTLMIRLAPRRSR